MSKKKCELVPAWVHPLVRRLRRREQEQADRLERLLPLLDHLSLDEQVDVLDRMLGVNGPMLWAVL